MTSYMCLILPLNAISWLIQIYVDWKCLECLKNGLKIKVRIACKWDTSLATSPHEHNPDITAE